MRENKTTDSPDFELCGACGAVLEKDAKFCNRCGVRLEAPSAGNIDAPEAETPEAEAETPEVESEAEAEVAAQAEKPAEAETPETESEAPEVENIAQAEAPEAESACKNCGAVLEADANFCNRCGARVEVTIEESETPDDNTCRVCGAELEKNAKFCTECGTRVAAAGKRFCMGCGADVTGAKFCTVCGIAVGDVNRAGSNDYFGGQPASPTAVETLDPVSKKRRKAGAILYIIGAVMSVILGFLFLCTPFLSVGVVQDGVTINRYTQNGIALIGVMFGGRSELTAMGANITLLRWAGWLYFVFLIAIINHGVCFALNGSRYAKGKRPFDLLQSNLAVFLAGVGILIVGCVARWQIGHDFGERSISFHASLSSYLGFIGVFVIALVGFACMLAAYICSNKTFSQQDKKVKKTGSVLAIFITDLTCAVLIVVMAFVPMFAGLGYNHDKEIEVYAGDSGKAATDCDEYYHGLYVGTTVFRLDDTEYGNSYIFSIDANDEDKDVFSYSMSLVYYYDVADESASEIYVTIDDVRIDKNDGNDEYLYFIKSTYRDLAVVVLYTSYSEISVEYEYSFLPI